MNSDINNKKPKNPFLHAGMLSHELPLGLFVIMQSIGESIEVDSICGPPGSYLA